MRDLRTAGIAIVGGALGYLSPLPGGALVGALLAVALLGRVLPVRLPKPVTVAAQLMIGAAAGALVTRTTLTQLWRPLLFGIAISVLVLGVAIACGLALARLASLDPMTGILCFVPGGLSEIAALADDFHVRTEVVIAVHLVRRAVTVALIVTIAAWSVR